MTRPMQNANAGGEARRTKPKIFVWGMGLMGASLSLRLKELGHPVSGAVRSEKSRAALLQMGFSDVYVHDTEILQNLADADMLILGINIEHVDHALKLIASQPRLAERLLIFDMCSTKQEICSWVRDKYPALQFVGAHPMAGRELKGPTAAEATLYDGATVFLSPINKDSDAALVERVAALWHSVGAHTQLISPEDHDALMASISHGPHLMACLIAKISDGPILKHLAFTPAAGSYRDMTRVATSSGAMWSGIVASNRKNTAAWLRQIAEASAGLAEEVEAGNSNIEELFSEAQAARKRVMRT